MERARSVYPELIRRLDKGEPIVLATVIEAAGSTPQVPGASALYGTEGLILGTLGGGALEHEAERRAAACLDDGRSLVLTFDLHGQDLSGEEPLCGGTATILIDGSPGKHRAALLAMKEALASRRRGRLVSRVVLDARGGAEIKRSWVEGDEPRNFGPPPQAARAGGGEREFLFFEPLAPLPRLLIAGAGHIGRAVARLGAALDFEVTVIDDRAEFASPERFPEADRLIVDRPGRALSDLEMGGDTFVVIVTRGHRDDAEALRACVRSGAAYIGMIGSRAKVAQTRRQFLRRGWATAGEFGRVHSPIGLAIGSRTVEEIAVSIAAELVLERSRRSAPSGGVAT